MSTNKRRGGYLATAEGVKKLKEARRNKRFTYLQIAEAARETEDKVKRLFNPQWGNGQYKVGEEAVEAICTVLNLKPEEIVSGWYLFDNPKNNNEPQPIKTDETNKKDFVYHKLQRKISQVVLRDKVKQLDLSNRRITKLPPEIGKLLNITHLYLNSNFLESLPPEIGKLSSLTHLYLDSNFLESLPPEIGKLSNLTHLYLNSNSLESLPPEIGKLSSLTHLSLNSNSLESLPPGIDKLSSLTYLSLESNSLESLPPEIGKLSSLTYLSLNSNSLSILSLEIAKLSHLKRLYLENNNLTFPPEIIKNYDNPITIINYYLSLQINQQKPLREAKMLLVGQGNVGKTCLKERLIRNDYDPTRNKTDGIDIEDWKIQVDDKELQVNIWDFGGQEIMHSTHQFFLTKRSLYLLVLDTTIGEEENRIEYWLKIIQSFGKDSPVIVVGNKADQHPLDIDRRGLQKKYPQIKAFYEVSCETSQGVDELAEFVKQEINRLEHIDDVLPMPWFNIKQELEKLDKDYIPYEQYESLCEAEGVEKEDNQRILISLLNDLGIVLNFQDDPRLEDTHVLNPEWVTNGVYKILNDRNLIVEDRGILTIPTIKRILDKKRYPTHKHLFIIGMMRKFELCFDVEADKQFLIPDILPKEEPYTGEWENALAFEYHYPVLPGSIISRFIVRMNHYIHQKTYWRSGVVLAHEGNLALVKADREDKIIKIRVSGKTNTRRNLLTAIRSQFDYIHKTIPGIVPVAKVTLIEHPEILLDYQELLGLEVMGEKDIAIGKLKRRISLKQLLNGIESESDRQVKIGKQLSDDEKFFLIN
ncbi:MAG: COR domain-containing protein [Cyanobacteria bacterium P01_A01_bin.40]